MPFLFKTAGIGTSMASVILMSLVSYFMCKLTFESSRLCPGNYKLKQKNDFEQLLSSHITSRQEFVQFAKFLYFMKLIVAATVGIVVCSYVLDNLF